MLSDYQEKISQSSKIIFNYSEHIKNKVKKDQNIFYVLNSNGLSAVRYLKEEYINEARKAVTTFKYYDLQSSLMKENVIDQVKTSNEIEEGINSLHYIDRRNETAQMSININLLKKYLDKYSYLLETVNTHIETLGKLKTDDLKYESHLVMQQLFDTMNNYGNTVYTLLNQYYTHLINSLHEFSGRTKEYLKYLDYFKFVAQIRRNNHIDRNTAIILVNILEDNGNILAAMSNDLNSGFYILLDRNEIELYPLNLEHKLLSLIFDTETVSKTGNIDILLPALCKKINDTEYKIINKGAIKFL
jgi:hypothetical protein